MYQSTMTRCRYVVLIVASVIICQYSTYTVQCEEFRLVNDFPTRFMTPLEARLRGMKLNPIERAFLAGELNQQSNSVHNVEQIEKELLVQKLQQQEGCGFGSSCLPIEEAAKEARMLVQGQSYGQLSTFLNERSAFNESLIGSPVSSVEMFVEACDNQLGNSRDLLVIGSELSARNLENEITKASLLVQGKYLESMSPRLQQYIMETQSLEKPIVHKVEVVLVGHMQKIDILSDKFMQAKQCIMKVHPEIEVLERVMPQRFGVWRFKIDGGVHMVDHMNKFIGWIPLEKYHTVIVSQMQSPIVSYPSEMMYGPSMQMAHRIEYPFHMQNMPVEREIISGMTGIELGQLERMEKLRQMEKIAMIQRMQQSNMMNQYQMPQEFSFVNGLPLSPFARKIMEIKQMRQMYQPSFGPKYVSTLPSSGMIKPSVIVDGVEYPSVDQFSGISSTQMQQSPIVVPTQVEQQVQRSVDANMISTL